VLPILDRNQLSAFEFRISRSQPTAEFLKPVITPPIPLRKVQNIWPTASAVVAGGNPELTAKGNPVLTARTSFRKEAPPIPRLATEKGARSLRAEQLPPPTWSPSQDRVLHFRPPMEPHLTRDDDLWIR
jgi:hypothetical protein